MGIPKWDDYVKQRQVNKPLTEAHTKENAADATGEPLDATYRQDNEYEKMLDFLRGKKNIANGALGDKPLVPKSASKGWFVVDEQSRGFWVNKGWSQDMSLANEALIDSEQTANEVAKFVGGLAIPAEEILGG